MLTNDKTILISGASRGLGLALAEAFLEGGNRVAAFARRPTEAVESLSMRFPRAFYFDCVDATDAERVAAFLDEASSVLGNFDCLVNNAAIGQDQLLPHMHTEQIRQIIETNILAPALLTKMVVKRMMLGRSGSICMISSICGSRGFAGLSIYAGSKGFLDAFSRSLARECGDAGISVNCVAPGFFESEMSSVLRPDQLETIRRRTPSGRLSTSQNVVAAVDLICSGTANINGQTIFVDGGITI